MFGTLRLALYVPNDRSPAEDMVASAIRGSVGPAKCILRVSNSQAGQFSPTHEELMLVQDHPRWTEEIRRSFRGKFFGSYTIEEGEKPKMTVSGVVMIKGYDPRPVTRTFDLTQVVIGALLGWVRNEIGDPVPNPLLKTDDLGLEPLVSAGSGVGATAATPSPATHPAPTPPPVDPPKAAKAKQA